MPDPLNRIQSIPPYVFTTLIGKKRAMEAKGHRVLDLSLGSPDQPMPDPLIEAVAEAVMDRKAHGYPVMAGELALRESFAAFMHRRFGVTIDPGTEVVPTAGAKEALANLIATYCEPGDVMLITDVAYPVYERAVAASGADLVRLPVTSPDYWPDLSRIPDDVARRAKFLLLNFPNNPTGAVATREQWAQAIEFCRRQDIILISDIAYSELVHRGEPAPSVFEVPGAKDVAVEIHSGSKNFSMAGLRLGMVCGRADVCKILNHYRTLVGYGVPTIVQRAGAFAFENAEALSSRLKAGYRLRFEAAVDGFDEGSVTVTPPAAGMYLWIPLLDGRSDWEITDQLLESEKIVITPGSGFGPGGAGHVRVSMVALPRVLEEACERIAGVLTAAVPSA